jgi:heme oxygenase
MPTTPTTEHLKEMTWELHKAAEGHRLQRSLLKGELSREMYATWLGQLLCVHRALESALRDLRERKPAVARFVDDGRFQESRLEQDLRDLGVEIGQVAPLPAAKRLMAIIEMARAERPIALLGMHYVLEGSTNGGRFIAKALRQAYGFEGESCTRYYDPYGDSQRGLWASYKQEFDALEISDPERDAMVAAARDVFRAMSEIGDDVLSLEARAATV